MAFASDAGSRTGSGRQPAGPFLPGSGKPAAPVSAGRRPSLLSADPSRPRKDSLRLPGAAARADREVPTGFERQPQPLEEVLTPKAAVFVDRHQKPLPVLGSARSKPGAGCPASGPDRQGFPKAFLDLLSRFLRQGRLGLLPADLRKSADRFVLPRTVRAGFQVRPDLSADLVPGAFFQHAVQIPDDDPAPAVLPGSRPRPTLPTLHLLCPVHSCLPLSCRETLPKRFVTGLGAPRKGRIERTQRTPRFSSQSLRSSLARCRRTFTVDSLIPRMRLVSSVENPSKSLRLRTTL